MKIRLLKKLLGNPDYRMANDGGNIHIGSYLCGDLISLDHKTLKIKYALDTFNDGRKALGNKTLEHIWDVLHSMVKSGEIKSILNGKDKIKNPLPVYTVTNGLLVKSVTDKYGWPNIDDNGICMYDNTHFPTKKEALKKGIDSLNSESTYLKSCISDKEKELDKLKIIESETLKSIKHLKTLLANNKEQTKR